MMHEIERLDHVNVAMPEGEEARADAFYKDVLGFGIRPKAPGVGGRWYTAPTFEIHLGIDPDFRPARSAHPAIVVSDLDELAARLSAAECECLIDEGSVPRRIFTFDPFGNRVELISA